MLMLSDTLDALGRNIDALALVTLIAVLMVTTVHSDRRYSQERTRNVALERRVRSLVLVVRFQQSLVDNQLAEPAPAATEPEVLDLSVDAMISRLGYCLSCHRLKAPEHFNQTGHLQLEDENLSRGEGH